MLVVLDRDFNYLGEAELDHHFYDFADYFVTPEGLYLHTASDQENSSLYRLLQVAID